METVALKDIVGGGLTQEKKLESIGVGNQNKNAPRHCLNQLDFCKLYLKMLTYYIPDRGETPEDAHEWPQNIKPYVEGCVENLAEYCFYERDGMSWSWPLTFIVLENGEEIGKYEVNNEAVPVFVAKCL